MNDYDRWGPWVGAALNQRQPRSTGPMFSTCVRIFLLMIAMAIVTAALVGLSHIPTEGLLP